jgi:hypothetical protein
MVLDGGWETGAEVFEDEDNGASFVHAASDAARRASMRCGALIVFSLC